MSYIGKKPSDITRAIANYDTFTGDGSTTTFTLTQGAASANDLTVVVNNVRQEPGSGSKSYTLTAPTSLVFNTAPAASDEIYVINPTQVEAIVRAGDISSGAITGQTAETTPADGDTLIMFDASAGALRKITKANLVTSAAITANTAKVTNATHTGEVTGSTALTIADNAVTLAKMASGTDGNLITYDASGDPAYVATGTAGHVLTSAGAGAPPTFAALDANKITLADQWHVTADIDADNSNTDTVITNWTQDGYPEAGKIGTMSESSGVFTFPSTGIYLCQLALTFYYGVAASNYSYARLQITTNNSSYNTRLESTAFTRVAENYATTAPVQAFIDVTNTTNVKVRPIYHCRSSGTDISGGSIVRSWINFIRLGDT